MTVREMQDEILRIKKEKDICILAHAYQRQDILDVADFVGDSFALSQMAAKAPQSTVLMCGVRFMAETAKILSPQKKVLLSDSNAGCPMAEQMDKDLILQLKEMYPDYKVVAYINTTSELKTVCDVCVTSSSAVKIVKKLDSDKILFIPDCNLGDYVQKQCPDKTFKLVSGGCPTHLRMTVKDVEKAKPELGVLNVMHLSTPQSAILSAVIFNALIIILLIPLALKGVRYRPRSTASVLRGNLLVYGLGGVIAPFIGIKLIDIVISAVGLV